MSLIEELKRRNVFRVAAAYLALGWVITQVTSTVAPALHLPDWITPVVVWIGVIGFPCVLLFSWAYELTPEGLKRESEVDRTGSITHVTGRRLDYIIIGMLAAAMLMFIWDRVAPRSSAPVAKPPVAESGATLPAAAATTATPATAPPVATVPDDKSIAVLPFVNMSEDANNAYFSDGLSEELLNLLAKIPQLHVAARTSSFAFKGKDVEIPEIARRLNVAHVLEGSVRKSGDRLRITAQLLRADNGYHLWSETYDRTLNDVFAVQEEIAAAVVEQLKVALLGAAPQVKKVDPKAYALYLQAHQLGRQHTPEGYQHAIELDQQALAIDPNYAVAWIDLSNSYMTQASQGMRPVDEGVRLAREATNKALAIDPEFALAHAQLGRLAFNFDYDLAASARSLGHALTLDPTNTDILVIAAQLDWALNRLPQAISLSEYVVARDPVNPSGHSVLGLSRSLYGQYDEAISNFRSAISLSPGRIGAQYNIGVALMLKGDAGAALAEIQKETDESWRLMGLVMIQHALGKQAESDAALAELIRKYEKDSAYNIAYVLAFRNEADRAFEWLDKAVASNDAGLTELAVSPLLKNIHADPRWLPFLHKCGKAPEQLAAIKFDVKLPD